MLSRLLSFCALNAVELNESYDVWILSLVKWMCDDSLLPRHTCSLQYLDCVLTLWLNSINAVSVQTLQCRIVCCDTAGWSCAGCQMDTALTLWPWLWSLGVSVCLLPHKHTLHWCNTTNSIRHTQKHQSSYLIKPCTRSWKDKGKALVDCMMCVCVGTRLSATDWAFWAMRACRQRLHTRVSGLEELMVAM